MTDNPSGEGVDASSAILPFGSAPQSTRNWVALIVTSPVAPSRTGIVSYSVLLSRPGVSKSGYNGRISNMEYMASGKLHYFVIWFTIHAWDTLTNCSDR